MSETTNSGSAPNDAQTPQHDTGSTSAAPTGQPTEPNYLEYRLTAQDGVPSWQIGRTVKEVTDLSQQMYTNMLKGQPLPQGVAPQPQSYMPQQPQGYQPQQQQPIDPDLWINDPAQAANLIRQQILEEGQQRFGSQFEQQAAQNAANARALAELRDPDSFKRWGPEIDMMLQQIPVAQRTAEVIQQAAQLVRGQHVEDLVKEAGERRAKEILEQMQGAGTLRSGGGVAGATSSPDNVLDLNDEQIPTETRQRLAEQRIGDDQVTEFLAKAKPYGNIPLSEAKKKYLELLRQKGAIQESVG